MNCLFKSILLLALVMVASGCSCLPQSFFQHINDGDHLLKVRIVAQGTAGWNKYYLAEALDVWQTTNSNIECNKWVVLRTATSSAACGVTWLTNGNTYLVNGWGTTSFSSYGIVDINSCGLAREWCSLADCELEALKAWQQKTCSCAYTKELAPVCALCNGVQQTFGNIGHAACEGWTVVSKGECQKDDCVAKCAAEQLFCFWGSPRCCADGSWECPGGTLDDSWYTCKPCYRTELSDTDTKATKAAYQLLAKAGEVPKPRGNDVLKRIVRAAQNEQLPP